MSTRDEAPPRPLRADARRNRDALIAHARLLFESGDEGVRFDDFAAGAGVGVGTLYRHFPTRESLAAAVYAGEVDALVASAAAAQATLPPAEALERFLAVAVERTAAGRRLARRLAALIASSGAVEVNRSLEQAVDRLVAAAVAAGAVRADARGGAVMMALHGIGAAEDRPGWRHDADALLAALVAGLRAPTGDAAVGDAPTGDAPRPTGPDGRASGTAPAEPPDPPDGAALIG